MKSATLNTSSRIILFISAFILLAVNFLPIWRIELDAPQYPEGLALQIFADDIKGNVDIINGLNHYIGMKTLHKEDFIEFSVLPYCIYGFSILFFVSGVLNKKIGQWISFISFLLFGVLAMVDFWKWEYDYGHNLNPDAAIQVPGMAYQPPLIGFKQLLNFGAYSIPDTGGWLFILVGILLLWSVARSFFVKKRTSVFSVFIGICMMSILSACRAEVKEIQLGRDNCQYCKMQISDSKFATAILSEQGKTFTFDDLKCLVLYTKENKDLHIKEVYSIPFKGEQKLQPIKQLLILESPKIKGPMGGHWATFSNDADLTEGFKKLEGRQVSWEELRL